MDRPRSDDLDDWWQNGTWHMGACGYQAYPDGLLTESELRAWRKELREKQRKRRPMGFTAPPPDVDVE